MGSWPHPQFIFQLFFPLVLFYCQVCCNLYIIKLLYMLFHPSKIPIRLSLLFSNFYPINIFIFYSVAVNALDHISLLTNISSFGFPRIYAPWHFLIFQLQLFWVSFYGFNYSNTLSMKI